MTILDDVIFLRYTDRF